jgi:hypothetical protein
MWITGNRGVIDPMKYNVIAFRKTEGDFLVQLDFVHFVQLVSKYCLG